MYQLNSEQVKKIVAILNGMPINQLQAVEAIVAILQEGYKEQEPEVVETEEV